MPASIEIFVPYIAPSTNSIYSGIHWSKRQKHVAQAVIAVRAASRMIKPFGYMVDLEFTASLGKGAVTRDTSNYSYSAKVIEDGIVKCGLLKDDDVDYVGRIILNPRIIDRKRPSGTFVKITRSVFAPPDDG